MECTLQIFLLDRWTDCAQIDVTNGLCQWSPLISYAVDHAGDPVSLVEPVDVDFRVGHAIPAFLFDLIPQGAGRRFLLGELGLQDGPAADFPLVCAGAFAPIGRIRVAEAVGYFDAHLARHPGARGLSGMSLDEVVTRSAEFKERMYLHGMLGTGTTGVQGAAPKYLLTRDREGLLHGDAVLPDARATEHFIAKLPRGTAPADLKVLRNEVAYMRVAAAMGIRTHVRMPGLYGDVLMVPRFDRRVRNGRVERLHQESVASLLGISGFDQRPGLFEVVEGIRRVATNPHAETIEFIKRDVLNLAMRNTDNHARNTAVQIVDGKVQLTPLFDFAPMYLDPELVPRALRWYRPDHARVELTEWGDVFGALPVTADERRQIGATMADFAQQVQWLPDVMAASGVDHDIVEFLLPRSIRRFDNSKACALEGCIMPRRTPLSREEQNAQRREFYDRIAQGTISIAEAMKAMRKMTGLTQAEFAAHRGVSRRVIQDIERGTGNPTLESLNTIGKLFGVQVGFVPIRRRQPVP